MIILSHSKIGGNGATSEPFIFNLIGSNVMTDKRKESASNGT